MRDALEELRRQELAEINAQPKSRQALEHSFGQVWDASQLHASFEVVGFLAPFVVVRRRADAKLGSLKFQHDPRLYFDFVPDEKPSTTNL